MKIILDAFGGDNAPLAPLQGAELAIKEYGVEIIAVGDVAKMETVCKENNISTQGMEFLQADDVFDMHEDPMDIVKKRKTTSLHVAMKALADGMGEAVVSAGSTGAMLMGATFIVKRIKGVKRAALGTVMPGKNPNGFMLMDCGANAEVRPEMLNQFAVMGSVYMEKMAGCAKPRVALLNNGAEDTKGTPTHIEAYKLLAANDKINFIGNIEGRYILNDEADVVVADGFSGNIALKTSEGVASFMSGMLKGMLKKNARTMLAAILLKNELKEFKAKMDYTEVGGAPILGAAKGVIKAHGSSNAKAFKNAIRQAKNYAENNISKVIADSLSDEGEQ